MPRYSHRHRHVVKMSALLGLLSFPTSLFVYAGFLSDDVCVCVCVCGWACARMFPGIQVHRVTRIHNRHLRNRFDKRVSDLLTCNPDLAAEIAARDGESGVHVYLCVACVCMHEKGCVKV